MSITLPHSFKDGVDEVASGVQVMDNLNALKSPIEALQALNAARPSDYAFAEAGAGRGLSTNYTPSVSRAAMVFLLLGAGPGANAVATVYVDGTQLFNGGVFLVNAQPVGLTFIVKAGGAWSCSALAGPINLLTSTYLLLPKT